MNKARLRRLTASITATALMWLLLTGAAFAGTGPGPWP